MCGMCVNPFNALIKDPPMRAGPITKNSLLFEMIYWRFKDFLLCRILPASPRLMAERIRR
jgi:hypothetical protein